MKKIALLSLLLLLTQLSTVNAQEIAIKTNVIPWATTAINMGAEFKISSQMTAQMEVIYKGWNFLSDNRKMNGYLLQPEVRYWFNTPFYKNFMGLHLHYGQYNGGFEKYRYQGDLYGVGVSYGYQWVLKKNWNLEVTAGLGYARMEYDKYNRPKCGLYLGNDQSNYIGPTKIGVSFIYILK